MEGDVLYYYNAKKSRYLAVTDDVYEEIVNGHMRL